MTSSSYCSNLSLEEVVALLGHPGSTLVTTHAKPDADALGSVVALVAAINRRGGCATGRVMPPVPAPLEPMMRAAPITLDEEASPLGSPDRIVVVDTGAWTQLEPMRKVLAVHLDRMLIIDHHLTGDVAARWRWIDGSAAACCEMLVPLIRGLGRGNDLCRDPIIRDALYAGIATDTGWFRFSNTGPGTLRVAADLVEAGVDHAGMYEQFEQKARPAKLRLLSAALEGMQWIAEDRAVVMALRQEDFQRAGAAMWETERLVDIPQMVGRVQVVVLATEMPGDSAGKTRVRLSFRSKPGPHAVDVAALAGRFGGGGHARAAGGQQGGTLEAVMEPLCRAVEEALEGAGEALLGDGGEDSGV